MDAAVPVEVLKAEIVPLLLGIIVAAAGAAAILLWLLRSKRREFALLYFGIACFMYGVRLVTTSATIGYLAPKHTTLLQSMDWVITSLIIFPFILFFVETVTSQWRKAAPWIVGAGIVLQGLVLSLRLVGA